MSQKKNRPAGNQAAPTTKSTAADRSEHNAIPVQLSRRRRASQRLPPLVCRCPDPWIHKCQDREPSERDVDAAAAALTLLHSLGTPGLLDRQTCLAVYRRGGYRRSSGAAR